MILNSFFTNMFLDKKLKQLNLSNTFIYITPEDEIDFVELAYWYEYSYFSSFNFIFKKVRSSLLLFRVKFFNYSFNALFMLFLIFLFDGIFDGDEPIWEPVEWSLVQTWILFIFTFSWIAENLITSKYGSFTGKDKRVWFSWYKSMWWIEIFYIITLGITIFLIITPFYFELVYVSSYIMNFWNWFSKVFFFKTIALLTLLVYINLFIQISIRFIHFKKLLVLIFINLIVLNTIFLMQFYMTFFSFFTDVNWYGKTKANELIQLSHEPWKWSWDTENRDHFQYHASRTVFWYKNDGPFAESLFLINLFYLFSLFGVILFWLVWFKKIISTNEFSYNYSLGAISVLRQFYYFYFLFYLFIIGSFLIIFLKFPYELSWLLNKNGLFSHFIL